MATTGDADDLGTTELAPEANEIPANSSENRRQGFGQGFLDTISTGWAERPEILPAPREQAAAAARRRDAVSGAFPGTRLVIPAGPYQVRSNDTDYPFRAHSAFSHLTGWASDSVPDSLLVFDPAGDGHDVTLFFRERADRTTPEFYADPTIGEFWIGPRPALDGVASDLGVATAHIDDFVAGADDLVIDQDAELTRFVSELRLRKDAYEISQMQLAVDVTADGFDDIVANLPRIIDHPRGERVVEGVFHQRARSDGNTVGYDTIAASGPHACYLHWTRNDGAVVPGDLILVDAGVEVDSLYTADVTRTLPISGTFSPVQRMIYEAVLDAADAAMAIVKPGIIFREVHAAAMKVIAERTAEWGLLPVSAEDALLPDNQHHRRYMVHGTSHHLGIDVHDCAQARREMYKDGVVEEGMVFTIEPGLYFQIDDLTVPAELRGIGVRIEDDILMTEDGPVNLSADIPRTADWGLLPVTADEALDADKGGQHRRYMVHGTSHHLGIDVHDCAQARRE
ncbi:MAG: aminopeptidase P family protein, partial [Microbacterium sp.]